MTPHQIIFLVFSVVIVAALVFDLGLLSKKDKDMTMKKAIGQTIFWVCLSLSFSLFIWFESGREDATRYISAYLLEWSLSVDNIFVFIILFNFLRISSRNQSRVLLMGILMAIIFRILFIAVGSQLVIRFDWILYVFGAFLLFTGFKMFLPSDGDALFEPEDNWAYKYLIRHFRTTNKDPEGKFLVRIDGKTYLTRLAIAVIMLGFIDVVFAVDSIPAVFSIIPDPNDKLLIFSSNIFAVLGLRSLFFLLHDASNRFKYLQQGIAIVLLFIGAKMIVKDFIHIPTWAALMMILVSIGGSLLYSVFQDQEKTRKNRES
jgi:tellurite resistance protein TerC